MLRETLRKLRLQRGWTQTVLSRESGVPVQTINNMEGGRSNGSPRNLYKLAAALDVQVSDLMEDFDTPKVPASVRLRDLSAEDRRLLVELVVSRDEEQSASMVRQDMRNFAHLMRAAAKVGVNSDVFKRWFRKAETDETRREYSPDRIEEPHLDMPEETTTLAAHISDIDPND